MDKIFLLFEKTDLTVEEVDVPPGQTYIIGRGHGQEVVVRDNVSPGWMARDRAQVVHAGWGLPGLGPGVDGK